MGDKLPLAGGGHERRNKPILCLDFDGVLHSYSSGWQGSDKIPDPPVPGFAAFLQKAVQVFDVCVFSSRSRTPEGRQAMRKWLANGLAEHFRAQRPEDWSPMWVNDLMAVIGFPAEKPAAFVSLDDRAVTFTGAWPAVEELLLFRTWQQKPVEGQPRLPLLPIRE